MSLGVFLILWWLYIRGPKHGSEYKQLILWVSKALALFFDTNAAAETTGKKKKDI